MGVQTNLSYPLVDIQMPPLIEPLSRHLLWVDDDVRARFRYEEHLLQERGWAVIWTTTTADAARFLAQNKVDAVATDNLHPLAEGFEPTLWGAYHLIKWLRREKGGDWGDMEGIPAPLEQYQPLDINQGLPVLIVSAFYDEMVEDRIRKLPQSDELSWLPKPLDGHKLTAFVETLRFNTSSRHRDSSLVLTIEEIEPAWDAVRKYLAQNPNYLHQMDPRKFELMIAEIFRDFGWEVDLTSRTRDGGYDIIAVRRNWPNQLRLLVEAKRFSPNRKVGVGIVRSLYGVKSTVAASQAILATSSYVTKDAKREFAHVIPWELDFLERDRILDWCALADPALLRNKDVVVER